jgi:hypothetical protein
MDHSYPSPLMLTARTSTGSLWTGRVLTGLTVAFLLLDAGVKLVPIAPAIDATIKLGFDAGVVRPLGIILAVSTLLHLNARTALLGAVLVSAYLGGATAIQVRAGGAFWFPIALGVLFWTAYILRDAPLRALLLSTRHSR